MDIDNRQFSYITQFSSPVLTDSGMPESDSAMILQRATTLLQTQALTIADRGFKMVVRDDYMYVSHHITYSINIV